MSLRWICSGCGTVIVMGVVGILFWVNKLKCVADCPILPIVLDDVYYIILLTHCSIVAEICLKL